MANSTLVTVTIENCDAVERGGGAHVEAGGVLTFRGSTVDACEAHDEGGAVAAEPGSEVRFARFAT